MKIRPPKRKDLKNFEAYKLYKTQPYCTGWYFNNLGDQELQNLANAYIGGILKPLSEIGRDAIIKELTFSEYLKRKERKCRLKT